MSESCFEVEEHREPIRHQISNDVPETIEPHSTRRMSRNLSSRVRGRLVERVTSRRSNTRHNHRPWRRGAEHITRVPTRYRSTSVNPEPNGVVSPSKNTSTSTPVNRTASVAAAPSESTVVPTSMSESCFEVEEHREPIRHQISNDVPETIKPHSTRRMSRNLSSRVRGRLVERVTSRRSNTRHNHRPWRRGAEHIIRVQRVTGRFRQPRTERRRLTLEEHFDVDTGQPNRIRSRRTFRINRRPHLDIRWIGGAHWGAGLTKGHECGAQHERKNQTHSPSSGVHPPRSTFHRRSRTDRALVTQAHDRNAKRGV